VHSYVFYFVKRVRFLQKFSGVLFAPYVAQDDKKYFAHSNVIELVKRFLHDEYYGFTLLNILRKSLRSHYLNISNSKKKTHNAVPL